jgi:hypothetical protein
MTGRTRSCDEATTAGRLRKAEQFLEAAETIREFADDEYDVGDAYVTLCVGLDRLSADPSRWQGVEKQARDLGPASKALRGSWREHCLMNRDQARSVEGKIRMWILEQEHDRRMERQLAGSDHRSRRSIHTSVVRGSGPHARA